MRRLVNIMKLGAMLLWTMSVALSCEHKTLCFDHSHMADLEIKFDWSGAPEADPNTMVVQLFNIDGSHYQRWEFSSKDGGKIRIEAGDYRMLFHNGEMSSVTERGGMYGDYELTTRQQSLLAPMGRADMNAPPRPEEAEDEPVLDVSEEIWGGRCEYVQILRGAEGQSVTLKPVKATSEYSVEVREVKNMTPSVEISAALTGMAQSWKIADNILSDQTATISFGLSRKDETTLVAKFALFGDSPEHNGKHFLSLYTSNKRYKDFDVTDLVHNAPDPKNVQLIVSGLELPEEGTGMTPGISGWEEQEFDINMN